MTRDRLSALIFLGLSVAYGVLAFQIELFPGSEYEAFTARTMPIGLAVVGSVVALLILVAPSKHDAEGQTRLSGLKWNRAILLCLLMIAYGATITRLGFVVSTTLFLGLGIVLLGERRWYVVLGVAVVVALGFWALLTKLLGIYLEPGLLL
jgi:putative tricarboxylic transport membrane protein